MTAEARYHTIERAMSPLLGCLPCNIFCQAVVDPLSVLTL
jgi:hypothetical protein